MQKNNKNKTVAPVETVAKNIEITTTAKKGRPAGVGNFVNINIAKLASLVGNGNVQVRRGFLEELLAQQQKAEIAAKINALSEPEAQEAQGEKIEMKIEE